MKILLDECTPRIVKKRLLQRDIQTVQSMGWAGIKNGRLRQLAEPLLDVFITIDKNLNYQQTLSDRRLAFTVLPTNQVPIVAKLLPAIEAALATIKSGDLSKSHSLYSNPCYNHAHYYHPLLRRFSKAR